MEPLGGFSPPWYRRARGWGTGTCPHICHQQLEQQEGLRVPGDQLAKTLFITQPLKFETCAGLMFGTCKQT